MTPEMEKFYAEKFLRAADAAARAEVIKAEFKAEFAAMMRKYKCEITVRTSHHGYEMSVDGIDFEFEGKYGTEADYPYFELCEGTSITAETFE